MSERRLQHLAINADTFIKTLKSMDGRKTAYRLEGMPADTSVVDILTIRNGEDEPSSSIFLITLHSKEFDPVPEGSRVPSIDVRVFHTHDPDYWMQEPDESVSISPDASDIHRALAWSSLCYQWRQYAIAIQNDYCVLAAELHCIKRIMAKDYFADHAQARAAYEQGWREAMNLMALRSRLSKLPEAERATVEERILDSHQEDTADVF